MTQIGSVAIPATTVPPQLSGDFLYWAVVFFVILAVISLLL